MRHDSAVNRPSQTDLMHGFPPAAATQVTLANWRQPPFCAWAFHHVREIIPTAAIANVPGQTMELAGDWQDLSAFSIPGLDGAPMDLAAFFDTTSTDGLVVLKGGKIAFERYANQMKPTEPHVLMSVSKSLLGLLAGALEARGALDLARRASDYVPEISDTAYAGASVRDLLDMRVGITFDEDYAATSGTIIEYRKATNWNPVAPGETASDLRSFFSSLTEGDRQHGGDFNYVSPNTDLLGWIIERATGARYADLMSDLIWQPLGAAREAYITVDRLGAPRCAGGLCVSVMDLARVGQMLVNGGVGAGGDQIVPEAWIDDLETGGDATAWNNGSFAEHYAGRSMHYRSKWYVERGASPLLFGMGIHGQNLFVDRKNEIVIAKVSSQGEPLNTDLKALTMRGTHELLRLLC